LKLSLEQIEKTLHVKKQNRQHGREENRNKSTPVEMQAKKRRLRKRIAGGRHSNPFHIRLENPFSVLEVKEDDTQGITQLKIFFMSKLFKMRMKKRMTRNAILVLNLLVRNQKAINRIQRKKDVAHRLPKNHPKGM